MMASSPAVTKTLTAGAILIPASIMALWVSLGMAYQVLFIMMGLDFIGGVLISARKKKLSSQRAKEGAINKAMILVIVIAAQTFQAVMGLIIVAPVVFGHQFELGSAVAIFFAVREMFSILEHGVEAGLDIPGFLVSAVLKTRGVGATPEQLQELAGITVESTDTRKILTAADGSTVEKLVTGTEVTISKDPAGHPVVPHDTKEQ